MDDSATDKVAGMLARDICIGAYILCTAGLFVAMVAMCLLILWEQIRRR